MDQIEEIKAKIDIVDFIKQYLDLKKAGINYSARCPFHTEKTPSFMVSAERQSFRCFGCGEGGDVISFFQKIECLSFPEALKILGEKVGVQVNFSKDQFEAKKTDKELIYQINLLAAKFFKLSLHDKVGNQAFKYLKDRGLSENTIEKLKIGFAPADSKLQQIFEKKKFDFQALSKAGHPERFRYRLMFPIFDTFGSVIGFSGRIIEEGLPKFISPHPKYLNTPETAVFHKSRAIYGINFAKDAIRQKKRVILVEGQMDVALSHEAGIEEVVASSGTALTQEHLKILSRLSENIIFCFDEDEAGQKAAESATELALEMGLDVKLTKIEGFKDVGELVKQDKSALAAVLIRPYHRLNGWLKNMIIILRSPPNRKKNL
jgi:DNA primase